MIFVFRRSAACAALLAGLFAAPAAAQSLLASRGLGYPIEPLDARSRGIGGVTTGLAEPSPSLVNPASAAGMPVFAFVVALQPERYQATAGELDSRTSTVRFPLLMGVFPVSQRLALQLGYGAYLDQHWRVQQSDSITLSSGRVAVEDRFTSAGGVGRFQAATAYRLNERLSLAVGADVFTGAAHDSAVRTIEGLLSTSSDVVYTYSGVGAVAGARWQPLARLSLSAALHAGGRVRAHSDSTGTEQKDYSNPLTVDGGASARIGGQTTVAGSLHYAGWSSADDALSASGGARNVLGGAAGVEYSGFRMFSKVVPLRLGGRYTQLPFRWTGNVEFPNERALTAGLGYRLGGGAAMLDAAAERGWRGAAAAGIDESYWRLSFSLQVLGR
jgi:hypothetical protein